MAPHQTMIEDQAPPARGNGNGEPASSSQHRRSLKPRQSPIVPQGARGLDYDHRMQPYLTLRNVVLILETDRRLINKIWFDDFLRRAVTADPPREWTDADDLELTIFMQTLGGLPKISLDAVRNGALAVAFRNRRHCVCDWLESLKWDQVSRIHHFFEDHFGAVATEYTRAASRNFWLSMVARVYRPGCQADNMIVLEGKQGIRKSAALRVIGGSWFTEQHESVSGKGFFEVLQGKLLVEISEMDSFSRGEVTRVKQVVTNASDRYRESYGRKAEDHPRQCVFVGTTNRDDWNRDETGARRFWPIRCNGDIDVDAIRAGREQFFAEAVARFKRGETWWEMPTDETITEQQSRYIAPAWVEPIQRYIDQERVIDEGRTSWLTRPASLTDLSIAEVLEFGLDIPRSQWTKANEMRVGEALRFMGWRKRDVWRGRTVKRWVLATDGSNDEEGRQ